ncbi:MAG: redoxin family protein [Acidobacteria bacterium]|nr:redoxin family protein [Acidobacteriota bacterium]
MIPKGELAAPEFGRVWINSSGLTLAELHGRAVLIDFWDYTCVNCLRTLPYVIEWDKRYREKGLTIIGVHAPEFSFARQPGLVRQAVAELGVTYPVVLDNNYEIWRNFQNRFWPAKYLIDREGFVRFLHFGEGRYAEAEAAIQELLREINPAIELPGLLPPLRDTDVPGAACYPTTPELYLGYARGQLGNREGFQRDQAADYKLPQEPPNDVPSLAGPWTAQAEFLETAVGDSEPASRLVLPYLGKEVNLVMAPVANARDGAEFLVRLRQDGAPLEPADAGADVEFTPEGESIVRVRAAKMYRLVANTTFGNRRLELETAQAGLGLFAFTFTTCTAE